MLLVTVYDLFLLLRRIHNRGIEMIVNITIMSEKIMRKKKTLQYAML
jgi:hypothetical protein